MWQQIHKELVHNVPGGWMKYDNNHEYLIPKDLTMVGTRILGVGEDGKSMYSDNHGATWTVNSNMPQNTTYRGVTARGNTVIAVTDQGPNHVAISTDRGATWSPVSSPNGSWSNVSSDGETFLSTYNGRKYMYSYTGSDRSASFTVFDENRGVGMTDVEAADVYGVDASTDLRHIGVFPLEAEPDYPVEGYAKKGDKYVGVRSYLSEIIDANQEAQLSNARLDEANVTIETMRSNFETRIAALELANVTTYNYDVTVVNTGYGNKYFIDGNQQPTLNVNSGDTLVFDQSDSSNTGHPLRIYEDEARTTEVSSGVTVDGTTITYVPSTTGTYYYQCQAHAGMGGQITVS